MSRRDLGWLPKTNLHIHLENAIRPATLQSLASTNGVTLTATTGDQPGIDAFFAANTIARSCLCTPDDFRRVAFEFCEDEAADGVRYAEVTFTVGSHGERLGDWSAVLQAVIDGLGAGEAAFGITCRLVLDHSRRRPVEWAWRTLELALANRPRVVALGLSGDERHPDEPYRELFSAAAQAELGRVPHAGEMTSAASVSSAITNLHADRIGHGINALDDPDVVRMLIERRVPLEVCPSSNVSLGVIPSLADHPITAMVERGLIVTLNTDIPSTTGVSLSTEYEQLSTVFGVGDEALALIARNGVDASFAPDEMKASLRQGIDEWIAT